MVELNKFENDEGIMKSNRFKKGLASDLGLNLLSVLFILGKEGEAIRGIKL